jgi:hypothetical protein
VFLSHLDAFIALIETTWGPPHFLTCWLQFNISRWLRTELINPHVLRVSGEREIETPHPQVSEKVPPSQYFIIFCFSRKESGGVEETRSHILDSRVPHFTAGACGWRGGAETAAAPLSH